MGKKRYRTNITLWKSSQSRSWGGKRREPAHQRGRREKNRRKGRRESVLDTKINDQIIWARPPFGRQEQKSGLCVVLLKKEYRSKDRGKKPCKAKKGPFFCSPQDPLGVARKNPGTSRKKKRGGEVGPHTLTGSFRRIERCLDLGKR